MDAALTLRRFRPKDAAPIRRLVEKIFREYGLWRDHKDGLQDLADIEKAYLRPGGEFLVLVKKGGDLVGCGGLSRASKRQGAISRMYLDPAWRRRGAGKKLLMELLRRAALRGLRRVDLETSLRYQDA